MIPPQYTLSRHVEVLLATGSTILTVDTKESQDQVNFFFKEIYIPKYTGLLIIK